jgi:O-antigen/teichoic acid export membrane protein
MTTRTAESLISSLLYLGLGRAGVLCMNLVTTSRLAHALGAQNFGAVSFSISYIAYFLIVVSLGYETFLTREIAYDKTRMHQLVGSVMTVRLLLAVGMSVLLLSITSMLHLSPITWILVMIQGINLFTSAIGLTCVYQGLQRMRVVAGREFMGSLFNVVGVMWLVHRPEDVMLAACITAGTTVLTNGTLLLQYCREFGFPRIHLPNYDDYLIARKSMVYFWAMLMITITYNIHIVILGLTRNNTDVGLFSVGWKLFNFAIVVPNLISTLFLPRIAGLTSRPLERAKMVKIYMQTIVVCAMPITIFGGALIPQILNLLFGSAYMPATDTVALLMVNALVVAVNIGFGIPLVAVGRQTAFLRIVAVGAAAGVILNFVLIPRLGPEGAGIGTLVDEIAILGMFIWDKPEVSVSQTFDFSLRCLIAAAPAGLIVHLVGSLPVMQGDNIAAIASGGAAGAMVYVLLLRLLRIDLMRFVADLQGLR